VINRVEAEADDIEFAFRGESKRKVHGEFVTQLGELRQRGRLISALKIHAAKNR
jgi:hypothetical protein